MSDRDVPIDVTAELPALRRYGMVLTRDTADAEELVHETLVRALEKRGSFRHGRPLRPWLLSILHNIFIDGTRRRRTEREALTDAAVLNPGHQNAPQDQHVRLNQLLSHFMALPEEQRAALHLVSIEGLSYAEAASALAIPVGTLMSRLGRARAALRELENPAEAGADAPGGRSMSAPQLKIVGGRDD
jgi:RNA polymerase sigma-70 factor (ECF subfamily)